MRRLSAEKNSERVMRVQVETFVDEGGVEKIRRFYLNGRQIEVVENLDQWHGADYRYLRAARVTFTFCIWTYSERSGR